MDFLEKGFASASDASRLLITLATGVIAFCVAVVNVKDADKTIFTPVSSGHKWLLAACWFSFAISVGVGVWTQLGITEVLSGAVSGAVADPWDNRIRLPFKLQILSFMFGLLALVVYAAIRLW